MRLLLLLLLLPFAASASAQPYNPTERYVTVGQDEPGYRAWYMASPTHPIEVAALNRYLTDNGVGWILPTWQVIRTASDWQRCGNPAFEVPPTTEWPHVVQTLRYIRDVVIPAVGQVEAVSAYRNPALNVCAGGAKASAHLGFYAIDMVPKQEIPREQLMEMLCTVHNRRGEAYGAGLGFYPFIRFHVDSMGFRRWGVDPALAAACPPIIHDKDTDSVGLPVSQRPEATPKPQPVPAQ